MHELARFTLRLARIQAPAFDFDQASQSLIRTKVLSLRSEGRFSPAGHRDNAKSPRPTPATLIDARSLACWTEGEWCDPPAYRWSQVAMPLAA